jgi:hypothetical protein
MKTVPFFRFYPGNNWIVRKLLRDTTPAGHRDDKAVSGELLISFIGNLALLLPFIHVLCNILMPASGVELGVAGSKAAKESLHLQPTSLRNHGVLRGFHYNTEMDDPSTCYLWQSAQTGVWSHRHGRWTTYQGGSAHGNVLPDGW